MPHIFLNNVIQIYKEGKKIYALRSKNTPLDFILSLILFSSLLLLLKIISIFRNFKSSKPKIDIEWSKHS